MKRKGREVAGKVRRKRSGLWLLQEPIGPLSACAIKWVPTALGRLPVDKLPCASIAFAL